MSSGAEGAATDLGPRQPSRGAGIRKEGKIPQVEANEEKTAIVAAALRRDYGERPALDGVGFELAAGATMVVLGPNGAGKTTLLRILATLLRPSGGEVVV